MIIDLQNDYSNTQEIVDLAARSVHNVTVCKGCTVALNSCGIAEDLVPPNNHVTRSVTNVVTQASVGPQNQRMIHRFLRLPVDI